MWFLFSLLSFISLANSKGNGNIKILNFRWILLVNDGIIIAIDLMWFLFSLLSSISLANSRGNDGIVNE